MPIGPLAPPRHAFDPVAEDLAFRLHSGGVARSLEELEARLAEAPAAVAWYHRGHFAPWVRDVVGDEGLARRLEGFAHTPDPEAYRDAVLGVLRTRLAASASP